MTLPVIQPLLLPVESDAALLPRHSCYLLNFTDSSACIVPLGVCRSNLPPSSQYRLEGAHGLLLLP